LKKGTDNPLCIGIELSNILVYFMYHDQRIITFYPKSSPFCVLVTRTKTFTIVYPA